MGTVQTASFGSLVRHHRVSAGLTQEELAERAGLSARAISDIERGAKHVPRKDTVELLAEALGLSQQERAVFMAAVRRLSAPGVGDPGVAPLMRQGSALPPLAGRTRESAALDQHLAGGGPPVLLLVGEPGIGKTRLLQEAALRARAGGWCVISGGCYRRAGQEPYAPLMEALQSYIRLLPAAQLRTALQRCAWLVRLLPELMDAADMPEPSVTLPPEQERRLMFGAVGRFLANVAGPAGTLLVLDDVQWAGPDALDLLAVLIRAPAEKPLRVVATYRDVDVRLQDPLAVFLVDLVRDGLATQHRLAPLGQEEAAELLRSMLQQSGGTGHGALGADIAERVLRRAEGVPFFLVSCAQGLNAGALGGDAAEGVPWDVAQTIRQRVASLPRAAQDILSVAAVVGERAPRDVLMRMATQSGMEEGEVLAALDEACQAGLLADGGDDVYYVTHDLIRDVVRDDLGAARRAALHRRVAEALERATGEPQAELLAYHFGRAGAIDKALIYLERAGDRAVAVHANAAATGYYREMVERLDRLGRVAESAQAREKLGATLRIVGRYDQALQVLERAAEAFRAAGDLEGLGRAMAQLGRVHARRGTPQEGVARLAPLVKPLEDAHAVHGLAAVQTALAELYFVSGRHREQLAAAERAEQLTREAGDDAALATAVQWRSIALLALGRTEEALPALQDVIPMAEAAGDLSSYAHTLNHVALAYIRRGEFRESQAYIERALAAAQQRGDPAQVAFMSYNRGLIAFFRGDWPQARGSYEQAAAVMREIGMSWSSVYPLVGLGQLHLVQGQWGTGAHQLQEATAAAERSGDLQALRAAQMPLAERELVEGRPEAARARLDRLLDRTASGWDEGVAQILTLLAWAQLELDDEAQTESLVALSITRAITEQNRLALVDALRVRALWAMRRQRWQDAHGALEEALSLARAMPYPYGMARVLFTEGLVRAHEGDPGAARSHLEASKAICAQLGERLYGRSIEGALANLPGQP